VPKERDRQEVTLLKEVYFLGAGASKSILPSMPTAAELTVNHLLEPSRYPDGEPPRAAIEQLGKDIEEGRLAAGFGDLRLEDALSSVFGDPTRRIEAHNLQVALFRRLGTPQAFLGNHPRDLESFLYAVQEDGAALISTNYDSLIECTLASMDSIITHSRYDPVDISCLGWVDYGADGVDVVPDSERRAYDRLDVERRSLQLLKLHGSIGWTKCTACHRYSLDSLFRFGAEAAMDGWGKCSFCSGTKREPVIVPPTFEKIYDEPAIRAIWARAATVLASAERLVFVGFSLHPSDRRLQEFLRACARSGHPKEVSIIDPSAEDLLPRFREVYGGVVRADVHGTFSEFLGTLTPDDFGKRMERRRRRLGLSPRAVPGGSNPWQSA
jgi:NAD-dependent SIR2 family protein deacetylase